MATKKLRQVAIENPSVDYIRPGKEKAFARLHKVLRTADANGNDDEVFKASKVKVAPRRGASVESSPKDSYGGTINNYDDLNTGRHEETQLTEKLGKDATTKDYIDDFIESDAPQFKGKSKAKRIQMAVAASYHKEDINEGRRATPLKGHPNHYKSNDELHYIIKDAGEAARNFRNSGMKAPESGQPVEHKYLDQMNDAATVLHHRAKGGKQLVRPKNEETESKGKSLHEVSKELLSRYINKASSSHTDAVLSANKRKVANRTIGMAKAKALAKDEETQLESRVPEGIAPAGHKFSKTISINLKNPQKDLDKMQKPRIKINKKRRFLRKEEALNELSPEKLAAYSTKASASHTDAVLSKDKKKLANRTIGMAKAKALMRGEESVNELYKDTDTLIKKAQDLRQKAWHHETKQDWEKGTQRASTAHKFKRALKASNIASKMAGASLVKEETLNEISDNAHELVLHADNDSHLHRSSHTPIMNNLKKKMKKGTYDSEKAKKLWGYHADRAAHSYHKEHGGGHGKWHEMFSKSDRKQAAAHWEAHHRDELKEEVSLQELSKKLLKKASINEIKTKTLNSYIHKSAEDLEDAAGTETYAATKGRYEVADAMSKKATNRRIGIKRASNRLAARARD